MRQEEIKTQIAKLEKAMENTDSETRKQMYKNGIAKLESKLEKEQSPVQAHGHTPSSKKSARKRKTTNVKTHGHASQPDIETPTPEPKKKKTIIKPKPEPKKKVKITPKQIVKQAIETQVEQKPVKKTLIIKKKEKEEKHVIDTAFGKDIEGAILSLNKARFIVREKKNRKTGETETVKHSQEYRNARSIQNKVDRIFNSAIADIAEKDKAKKRKIEELAKELRDIHVLWINEIDIIISNGEIEDMENLKKMLIGLLKEARKNDEDNKWRNAAGLETLAKKYL
jgi:hypothetical protein